MLRSLFIALALIFALDQPRLSAQSDSEIQVEAQNALRAYSLTALSASVQNGSVTLKGSVNSYPQRRLADEVISQIHGVKTIQDGIKVSAPRIADAQLKTRANRIITDRIRKLGGFGYGSISAQVKDGAVILTGFAAPRLAEPAINEIAGVVGVKNLIDHIQRTAKYESHWQSGFPGVEPVQAP